MATPRIRLRLGVSHCLLGASVRYDGDHRRDHFVAERLAPMVDWVAVCPEHDSGMGTPRPAAELRGEPASPSFVEVDSGRDRTKSLAPWCQQQAARMLVEGLDGFVLKARSPSCGLGDATVHGPENSTVVGDGLFVRALHTADPELPCCRGEDLPHEERRRDFLLRATSRARCRALIASVAGDLTVSHPSARTYFERHRLALCARGVDWAEAVTAWESARDFETAARWLAASLRRPETPAGQLCALREAVDWLEGLDARHWWALGPMLKEVESGSLLPAVPRVTLRLLAQTHTTPRLLEQLYLHPWLDGLGGGS